MARGKNRPTGDSTGSWKGVDHGEEAVEVSKILKSSHGFGAIWIYRQVLSYILESRVFKNLHERLNKEP